MGQLYKRGGTWYADYFDRKGNRRRESTRTGDIKVARARLRDRELATTTDRGAHQTEKLAVALTYFVDVVHAASPAGTVRCYRQKAAHINRLTGDVPLTLLTRETVERYIATRLNEGAHRHSVHKELVVLRGALASARQRQRFTGPVDLVPKFSTGYVPRSSYLTPEQLRWEHIDLATNTIRLPKGKTVARPITIAAALRPWLERLHRGAGPVVEPWNNVVRDLARACLRAGVPRVTPNDLRRTFASWLVQGGASLLTVSRLLGHSKTSGRQRKTTHDHP